MVLVIVLGAFAPVLSLAPLVSDSLIVTVLFALLLGSCLIPEPKEETKKG